MKKQKRPTHGAMAMALGLNVRHVRRLIASGMPADSVAAARKWREENISNGDDPEGLNALRGDLVRARTRLAELEHAERTRELIPAREVQQLLVKCAQALRAQLGGIAKHLRGHHPNLEPAFYAELGQLHDRALGVLSGAVAQMANE